MIRPPPGAPSTSRTFPSLTTIVGVIDDSMRLLGAIAFALPPTRPNMLGVPGRAAKSSISSLSRKPQPATTSALPNVLLIVVVHATALPSLSTTEKCVVSSLSFAPGGNPGATSLRRSVRNPCRSESA